MIYLYKATYWDDFQNAIVPDWGAVYADSFMDASNQIEDYYGEDLETLELKCFDCGLLTFDADTYEKIKEQL